MTAARCPAPSQRRAEAERAWSELRDAITRAEAALPAVPRRNAAAARPSRYATGAGIHEDVPQK